MADEKIRKHFGDYLCTGEVAILTILAVLISLTALATIIRSGKLLWDTWHQWMVVTDTDLVLRVLDQLLVVLMLVEILHTVRIPSARTPWLPSHFWSWGRSLPSDAFW